MYNTRAYPKGRPNTAPRCQVPKGQTREAGCPLDGPKGRPEKSEHPTTNTKDVFTEGVEEGERDSDKLEFRQFSSSDQLC